MKYGDLKELWPELQPVGNTTQETWRAPEKMEVKKKNPGNYWKLPAPDDNVNTSSLLGGGTVEALLGRLALLC